MQNRWLKNGLLSLLLVLLIGTGYAADAEIHRHPLPASSKELVWEPLPTDGTKLVPGNYYLTTDYTVDQPLSTDIGKNISICLNGHTLYASKQAILVNWESTITICDCSKGKTGSIQGTDANRSDLFLVRRDDDDEDEDSGTLLLNGCKLSGVWGVENCGGTFEAVNVTAVMERAFLYGDDGYEAKITDSNISSSETAIIVSRNSLTLRNTVVQASEYAIKSISSDVEIYGGTVSGESADISLNSGTLQLHGRIDGLDRIDVIGNGTICANAGGTEPFETSKPVMLYISDRSAKLAGQAIVTDAEEGQFELANSTEDVYLIYDAESKSYIYHCPLPDLGRGTVSGTGLTWRLDGYGTLTISGSGAIPDATSVTLPWPAYYSQNIKSIVIGAGCTSVGERAFWRYQYLERVRFENSVDLTLGDYAFAACPALKRIDFAGTGTIVPGDCVFESCEALSRVTIPSTVQMNGTYRGAGSGYRMFGGCKSLSAATLDCAYIGPFPFEGCSGSLCLTFTDPNVRFYFLENQSGHPINTYNSAAVLVGHTCSAVQRLTNERYNSLHLTFVPIKNDQGSHQNVIVDVAVAPTCTEAGKTAGRHCGSCNAVLAAQTAVPAKGHTWAAASCCAAKHCTECGQTEGEPLPVSAADGNVTYVAYARSEDLPEDGAVLCIARYDGGRMTAYRVLPLNAQNRAGTCTLDGSGTEYRLFLLSPEYCPIAVQRMIQET